ncbi:hypothetical protein K501DRAFT_284411 [Backusella circina FSU 941]|nr:hypothetical protein K501DRAFT_284411 [Backusella circina FSU 941]
MALSFQDLGRLAEAHFQRVKLDKFIEPGHSKEALLYLLGILYDSFDSRMVERYIEQTIKDILLNKYPLEEDAVSTLTKFIISKKGNMDASYAKIADQWKVTLACKLRPNGIVFAVDAIGNSKQKAKSVACQTIVKYFKDHPEELEKFETGQAANDQHQVIQLMTSSTDNNNTDLLEEEIKKEEIKNECIQQTESILGSVKPSSNSKSLDVFRDIFRNDLTKLRESNTSHDIKGAMLNVLNNKPSVTHNTTLTQTGEVHNPIFQVDLVIKSGKHTLRESASARKKKDAEIYAYQKIAKKLLL